MKKIDLTKIRGVYEGTGDEGEAVFGGDDTVASIRLVAEKVNELIDQLNLETR